MQIWYMQSLTVGNHDSRDYLQKSIERRIVSNNSHPSNPHKRKGYVVAKKRETNIAMNTTAMIPLRVIVKHSMGSSLSAAIDTTITHTKPITRGMTNNQLFT